MTDRHEEGIEKAARAAQKTYVQCYDAQPWEFVAHAAVAAYLDHAFPEVTSAEELDALPDATILRDAEGVVREVDSDDEAQWACVMGHEDGYPREDIHLPARVIWWGLG